MLYNFAYVKTDINFLDTLWKRSDLTDNQKTTLIYLYKETYTIDINIYSKCTISWFTKLMPEWETL